MVDDAIELMSASVERSVEVGENAVLAMNYRYLANALYEKNQSLNEQCQHYYQLD